MTVEQMIDALNCIEDKSLKVTMGIGCENVEVDDFTICDRFGWIDDKTRGQRKVVLLME